MEKKRITLKANVIVREGLPILTLFSASSIRSINSGRRSRGLELKESRTIREDYLQ